MSVFCKLNSYIQCEEIQILNYERSHSIHNRIIYGIFKSKWIRIIMIEMKKKKKMKWVETDCLHGILI